MTLNISVETHYDGQMKEAISKPWKVRTWKSDGSITFYKQLDDLKLYPRIWIVDVNNEIPPSIKQALLNALTEPLYSIKTWDPDLQKYTPQIDVPSDNLTRAQLVASMRMLQEIGYSCHRIRERDDDGNHTGYADSDAYVMIERIN